MTELRICKKCLEPKDESAFGLATYNGKKYLRGWCKPCHAERTRQAYADKRDGITRELPPNPPPVPYFQHLAPAPKWLELRV